jgi:hypothetical protein
LRKYDNAKSLLRKNDQSDILADRVAFAKEFGNQLGISSFDENLKITPIIYHGVVASLRQVSTVGLTRYDSIICSVLTPIRARNAHISCDQSLARRKR